MLTAPQRSAWRCGGDRSLDCADQNAGDPVRQQALRGQLLTATGLAGAQPRRLAAPAQVSAPDVYADAAAGRMALVNPLIATLSQT